MTFLLLAIVFLLGMGVGGCIVFRYEEKIIVELNKRCAESGERLNTMINDEEKFLDTLRSKHDSLGDYMKTNRDDRCSDWDDCEDESDNLYI